MAGPDYTVTATTDDKNSLKRHSFVGYLQITLPS